MSEHKTNTPTKNTLSEKHAHTLLSSSIVNIFFFLNKSFVKLQQIQAIQGFHVLIAIFIFNFL